jgi:hypothetical protein
MEAFMKLLVVILASPLLLTGCPDKAPTTETPAASAEPPKPTGASDKAGTEQPAEKKDDKAGGGW